jgi:hypothetical protein
MPDATTASDWLPTFEFGLANDSSCLKRPVRVSGAEGRFTRRIQPVNATVWLNISAGVW